MSALLKYISFSSFRTPSYLHVYRICLDIINYSILVSYVSSSIIQIECAYIYLYCINYVYIVISLTIRERNAHTRETTNRFLTYNIDMSVQILRHIHYIFTYYSNFMIKTNVLHVN